MQATIAAHMRGFMAAIEAAHPFNPQTTTTVVTLINRMEWVLNEMKLGTDRGVHLSDPAWSKALDLLSAHYKAACGDLLESEV